MSASIGVYKITLPSGSCYVGMTTISFDSRWRNHLKELRNGRHPCRGLKSAFAKYGEAALLFEILEKVPNSTNQSVILLKERDWWDKLKAEGKNIYNGRPTGTGSVHHTDEQKKNCEKPR